MQPLKAGVSPSDMLENCRNTLTAADSGCAYADFPWRPIRINVGSRLR